MSQTSVLVVNGRRIAAAHGQTLLEAALAAGTVIPHDCATGQCNTCRVRIYAGAVEERRPRVNNAVLACQARVIGEAVIEFDEVPDEVTRRGTVGSVVDLSPDIVEVVVALDKRLTYLPGQYVKATFRGFPARDYSPTLRVDGSAELNELVFNIRREDGGVVSSAIGGAIRPGSRVRVRGPFGQAYHRLGSDRLVLIASGVGWAPLWAIARASRFREPEREMVVVAGARHATDLYMRPCLDWLSGQGATAVLTCSGRDPPPDAKPGRTTLHVPPLRPSDTVIAAGTPMMVAAVELLSAAGGATCYADPFYAAEAAKPSLDILLHRIVRRLWPQLTRDRPKGLNNLNNL